MKRRSATPVSLTPALSRLRERGARVSLRDAHVNQVRIIGGSHRGRKLHFHEAPGLRPTPDRVRETLFNWLGQRLHDLRCLDLFAGSGALGFEAISRGAAEVVLVERDAKAAAALEKNAATLGGKVVRADGLTYLKGNPGLFDIIFIDPPFAEALWGKALALAATRLAPEGKIYLEHDGSLTEATLATDGWSVLREGRAGQSHFCLLERAWSELSSRSDTTSPLSSRSGGSPAGGMP